MPGDDIQQMKDLLEMVEDVVSRLENAITLEEKRRWFGSLMTPSRNLATLCQSAVNHPELMGIFHRTLDIRNRISDVIGEVEYVYL